ncbi:MAG: fused protease/ribonucleoside-triphosphate reductase [Saprospiraceae bacterium]|nr:fused protease/ribonucleoside-triphosphate reductase [Saprospiraceae bacterium]MBK9630867.1 fused protease/ribonucleoside-triphosphate reductase [Saprospiraceae bacterium]
MLIFKLSESFVEKYRYISPEFGFNGLGMVTYYRTYSRLKEDGTKEAWYETVRRVVEGAYSIQKEHILLNELGWNDLKANASAEEMYDRMFKMKFLPPGRMLWALGTELVHTKKIGQALFNCAFVSTSSISSSLENSLKPFAFMMDMSMVGVGVGFDVKGAGGIVIQSPVAKGKLFYQVPDSREGWVESLRILLRSFFSMHFTGIASSQVCFDYSLIRKSGEPIKGFGGKSSGPIPLMELHQSINNMLSGADGQPIGITNIVDIMNLIGQCVVAGNVRRTAQIALGPASNDEYEKLKDYQWNAEKQDYEGSMAYRASFGWTSNNSIVADMETDLTGAVAQTIKNGEPGYIFMDNIRAYSRMCAPPDHKDIKAEGTNPCGEQTLESFELCCLVETFPSRASSLEDFLRTLKFAYLLGKTATLATTTWPESNRVQKRNRRIGTSVSGISNFLEAQNLETLRKWLVSGYQVIQNWDIIYSSWLCVPKSIKTTSVKPSGTVSLLAGVNPGVHYPEFTYYIRRIRIAVDSYLLPVLKSSGFEMEPDMVDSSSWVVSFPIYNPGRNLDEVTIWEQVALSAFLQKYWSDNQVSSTVSFKSEEADQIKAVLDFYRYDLKSISFLPRLEKFAYAQMPYEAITKDKFQELLGKIGQSAHIDLGEDVLGDRYCTNDQCMVV